MGDGPELRKARPLGSSPRGPIGIEQSINKLRKTTFRASEALCQSVLDRVTEHRLAQEE